MAQGASRGQEALKSWVMKSVLQFGFERIPGEASPAVSRLLEPGVLEDWGRYETAPGEVLSISKPGRALHIELVRDNGPGKKPTIVRGHYDGRGGYSLELQFPHMSERLLLTQQKKLKDPAVAGLSDSDFADWLVRAEGLEPVEGLARRQVAERSFAAWEHLPDKNGNPPAFSPRASLLGEIMTGELFHLFDGAKGSLSIARRGRVRVDAVYGYLGDSQLGEAEPLDWVQARQTVEGLGARGYKPSGGVLRKAVVYKGKEVEVQVRVSQPGVPNGRLARAIGRILERSGISDPRQRDALVEEILERGKAQPFLLADAEPGSAQFAADAINDEIAAFDRIQDGRSFRTKRAFEEALARADVVVYDGHSGAGEGFRFGPMRSFWNRMYWFYMGRLRPHIYEPIQRLKKHPWLSWLIKHSPAYNGGYIDAEIPFYIPWPWGEDFERLLVDPLRRRQLLFLDSCSSIKHYERLWEEVLRVWQEVFSPGKFDIVGTTTDASTGTGVETKLAMIESVEKGANAHEIVQALRAAGKSGKSGGTQYAPGRHMGVDGEGEYADVFGEPRSRSSHAAVENSDAPGFILDNNGARAAFLPSTEERSYPYWGLPKRFR